MIRINLLPHREEKRKARARRFHAVLAGVALLSALVVLAGHTYVNHAIEQQEARNAFLKKEIVSLDKEIEDIKRLRGQIDAVLSRKRVIEALQANRAQTVLVLNELARQVPEGISLRSVKQAGSRLTLAGYAQSNARVSTLMRNLDATPVMENARLIEIKAGTTANRRVSEFSMTVDLEQVRDLAESPDAPNKTTTAQGEPNKS